MLGFVVGLPFLYGHTPVTFVEVDMAAALDARHDRAGILATIHDQRA